MESNRLYHYCFKFSFLAVSLVIGMVVILSWLNPASVNVDGEPGVKDPFELLVLSLISLAAFLLFLLVKDKFAIVKLGGQNVTIQHKGQHKKVSWQDVEEVKQIRFIFPPLYKLEIKDLPESYWFNTEPIYFNVSGFVSDMSDMGQLIKKKKKELGI
jgi:hypothetical protein